MGPTLQSERDNQRRLRPGVAARRPNCDDVDRYNPELYCELPQYDAAPVDAAGQYMN
jgi:hypothetical protein